MDVFWKQPILSDALWSGCVTVTAVLEKHPWLLPAFFTPHTTAWQARKIIISRFSPQVYVCCSTDRSDSESHALHWHVAAAAAAAFEK